MQTDIENKAIKPGAALNKGIDAEQPEAVLHSFYFEAAEGKPARYIDAHSKSEAKRIYEQNN